MSGTWQSSTVSLALTPMPGAFGQELLRGFRVTPVSSGSRVEEAARGGLRHGHSGAVKRDRKTNRTGVPRSRERGAAPTASSGASPRQAGSPDSGGRVGSHPRPHTVLTSHGCSSVSRIPTPQHLGSLSHSSWLSSLTEKAQVRKASPGVSHLYQDPPASDPGHK